MSFLRKIILCVVIVLVVLFLKKDGLITPVDAGTKIQSSVNDRLKTGLVGLWSFDNQDMAGTDAYDKSTNFATGTLSGITLPKRVSGKIGQALSFNGSTSYVTGTNNINITSAQSSVSLWVKFDAASIGPGKYKRMFEIADSTNSIQLIYDGDVGTFGTKHSQFETGLYGTNWNTSSTPNRWYHIVTVWDSVNSTTQLYVDGVLKTGISKDNFIGKGTQSSKFYFGVRSDFNVSTFLSGQLDDIRFYNRTLSVTEVKQLYNMGASKVNASTNARAKSSLVGLWSFDNQDIYSTTAYDRGGNGFNGAITGSAKIIGKIGQALKFNNSGFTNSDYVSITDQTALRFSGVMTASVWIKTTKSDRNSEIISKGGGTSWEFVLQTLNNGSNINFATAKCDGTAYLSTNTSGLSLNDGAWHHIVGTASASAINLYIDGILQGTSTTIVASPVCAGGTNAVRIGYSTYTLSRDSFNGTIDDARLYNRTLSITEVKELYNMGASKVNASTNARAKSSLVGLWSFDNKDMAGTDVYDKSTNFATGTLSGATLPKRVSGKIGQALSLNGSTSYVTVADSSSLDQTSTLTLSTWVRPTAIANGSDINSIVEKGDVTSAGYGILATNSNRFCGFVTGTSGSYGGASTNSFNLNMWHHVVMVVNKNAATVLKLYVDGTLETLTSSGGCTSASTFSGSITPGTAALTFGARSGSSSFFNGRIDDTRVYNSALSATEVKQLYNLGK